MSKAKEWRQLRPTSLKRSSLAIFFLLLGGLAMRKDYVESAQGNPGILRLSIVDKASGKITPARIELLDEKGSGYVAADALPVRGDCVDRQAPLQLTLERAVALLSKKIDNPHTGTIQFYSVGNSEVSLPAGSYQLKAFKGIEYLIQKREIHIQSGKTVDLRLEMSRWINLPEQGWYSADAHLHIARPIRELDPFISKWMQAEDVHVGNFLQWGHSKYFHNTPQYAHGPAGFYREGDYLLATGQENPRTHFRGHTITLGAHSSINFPESYLLYQLYWEEARRQGALSGYAHFGLKGGAPFGLAIDLPDGLLSFLEVLQFNDAVYDVWYDILNTGFRLAPIAGTDYPCLKTLPGRDRFYTQVQGPLTYEAWLEGVRRGRTFVTNGPVLEFRVNSKGMGEEVALKKSASVLVEGRVRFDPTRDAVERLEVIENGELLRSFPRAGHMAEISFQFQHHIRETAWLAVRAIGTKLGETLATPSYARYVYPPSLAHSAAIYVAPEGAPGLSAHPRARVLARAWIARLEDLEMRLTEDNLQYLAEGSSDGVDLEYLRKNRLSLLTAIQTAKKHFRGQER